MILNPITKNSHKAIDGFENSQKLQSLQNGTDEHDIEIILKKSSTNKLKVINKLPPKR